MQRARSTRQNGGYGGALDPMGYVGRRLWRLWPAENPPWVEGFIQQWDPGEQRDSAAGAAVVTRCCWHCRCCCCLLVLPVLLPVLLLPVLRPAPAAAAAGCVGRAAD